MTKEEYEKAKGINLYELIRTFGLMDVNYGLWKIADGGVHYMELYDGMSDLIGEAYALLCDYETYGHKRELNKVVHKEYDKWKRRYKFMTFEMKLLGYKLNKVEG